MKLRDYTKWEVQLASGASGGKLETEVVIRIKTDNAIHYQQVVQLIEQAPVLLRGMQDHHSFDDPNHRAKFPSCAYCNAIISAERNAL